MRTVQALTSLNRAARSRRLSMGRWTTTSPALALRITEGGPLLRPAQTTPSTNGASAESGGRVEVAVIGAGQAGLAIGHFLARAGRRFVILEAC